MFKNKRNIKKKSVTSNKQKSTALLLIAVGVLLGIFLAIGYYSFLDLKSAITDFLLNQNNVQSLQIIKEKLDYTANIIHITMFFTIALAVIFGIYFIFHSKLHNKINTDSLTGVKNRHFLESFWEKENHKDYILVQADIDHFKKINDKYGHDIGDITIKLFAETLVASVRANKAGDYVVRMGGEEFLILIKHNDNKEAAINAIARMQKNVRSLEIPINDVDLIKITSSFGVNLAYETSESPEESIKRSDIALYMAKKERDKIDFFTNDCILERNINKEKIQELINKNRVICLYQPVVDLKTNEIVKYEALTRIIGDTDIVHTPQTFFAIISGSDIEIEFIKHICELNIKEYANFKKPISINMTSKEFILDGFIPFLHEKLSNDNSISSIIEFEISDFDDILDIFHFEAVLIKIRELGFKISIDKFGTKYSQIIHLMKEVDEIKIDGNLIKSVQYDEKVVSQIQSMISFAKSNNVKVSAVHIENKETKDLISSYGVDYGQGYFIGKPIRFSKEDV